MGIRPFYGIAPQLGRSPLHFLKCNKSYMYISGYGKVLSRTWNGAQGFLCLSRGHDFNLPLHAVSVHCIPFQFNRVSSQLLGKFTPPVGSLENSCSETLLSLGASSTGYSGQHRLTRMGRTKKAPLVFPFTLIGRGSHRGACLGYSADYTSQIICTTPQWETVFQIWDMIGFLSSIKAFLSWRLVVRPATIHIACYS